MSAARTVALVVAAVLGVPLLAALGIATWAVSELPPAQAERIRGPNGVLGVNTGGSFAWIVPSATGVVLVDAGIQAEAVLAAVGQREIRAVLLTHGHADHVAGLRDLPAAPVYGSPETFEMLAGERAPDSLLASWLADLVGPIRPLGELRPIAGGQEIEIDGLRFRAVDVPTHAVGSTAWLWEDVLFVGDAVLGGGSPLALAPPALSDELTREPEALRPLVELDFDTLADGHVGLTGAGRSALARFSGAPLTEPKISVRSASGVNPLVERRGVYVQTPAPDVRGEQPALVVFPGGEAWRIADAPVPEHADLVGKTVAVRARLGSGGAGRGLPVVVESLRLAEEAFAANRPLRDRVGEWVEVTGTVKRFEPHTAGASWGEGEVVLTDGTVAGIAAPHGLLQVGSVASIPVRVAGGSETRVELVAGPRAAGSE